LRPPGDAALCPNKALLRLKQFSLGAAQALALSAVRSTVD
jgi:hypothetical protein